MIDTIFDVFKFSFTEDNHNFIKMYFTEIKISIKMIYYLFMFIKKGSTEGQQLYNVMYDLKILSRNMKIFKLIGYVMTKILVPYILEKINSYIARKENYESISKFQKVLFSIFKIMELSLKVFEMHNFIKFLMTNEYSTLWNRIFNLKYVNIFF